MHATIHEAITQALSIDQPHRSFSGMARLYVSEFGNCPRRAMYRVMRAPSAPFPAHVREVMSLGNAYEEDTAHHLAAVYGPSITRQHALGNDVWSGRADFFIRQGEQALIVEHKATGDKYFDFDGGLPKPEHVAQTWLYGRLCEEAAGFAPCLVLYYRSWGHYAEFQISDEGDTLVIDGLVDGKQRTIRRPNDLPARRAALEEAFRALALPPCPAGPSDEAGCTFRGEPSCGYYKVCKAGSTEVT